ncbi:MAG: ABC transporter ATP-binding protein [Pseudomonadota bacterium]|nr:ABC transporter ATP-binding protein [Pseudomonadota bacterium]
MEDIIIIELINVSKTFAKEVRPSVDNISITINKGEILVLIGSSGSGKSTLLKLINGLEQPSMGTVLINGNDITSCNTLELRRTFFSYVFQKVGLFPHMTVQQNINVVMKFAKKSPEFRSKRILELLDFVQLDPSIYLHRYPSQLSGGEQQRVGVARALATDSECMLMDEPFGALDALTRNDLQKEILLLRDNFNKTIIFVTHDIAEAFKLGDRIAVLQQGKLEQIGTKEELCRSPKTSFVEQMVNAGLGDRHE